MSIVTLLYIANKIESTLKGVWSIALLSPYAMISGVWLWDHPKDDIACDHYNNNDDDDDDDDDLTIAAGGDGDAKLAHHLQGTTKASFFHTGDENHIFLLVKIWFKRV